MRKGSPKTSKKVNLANTHVPDKVYAYSLQISHALYELLNCSTDDIVSIEVLDDVAVQKSNDCVEATQVKSVLSNRNPISNRATDLWKTFYNWLIAVKENELVIDKTIFKLFVTANKNGTIADSFSLAQTLDAAEHAWRQARAEFYVEKNNEMELSEEIAVYIRALFDIENKNTVIAIIQKFTLTTIKENYTEVLYTSFCEKAIIPDDLHELAFTYMLGWINKKVAKNVEAKKAMAISYNDYRSQLIAITRELNQKQSLIELAPPPSDEQVQLEYGSTRVYLEQLSIIDCDYTEQIEAINDYIRASTNRVLWARRGDISEKSFMSYQENLIKQWRTKKEIINIRDRSFPAKERGMLLFLECKSSALSVNDLSVPSFFTPGCYHALSDTLAIGWHPEYKNILSGEKNNE